MADVILFRGAHIRHLDLRQEEGGTLCRIHVTADFSTPVITAMEWEDPGSSAWSAKLKPGELHATHMILTPGDKSLRKNEIQFDIRLAEAFELVTVKEKDSTRRELRFQVISGATGVAGIVEEYLRLVGDHQGAMKVSYTKQEELALTASAASTGDPRQSGIDEALYDDRDTGCTSCNTGIPLMDGTGKHDNGMKCTAEQEPSSSTLASAREADGGTHARKGRRLGPDTGETKAQRAGGGE
jgi:hypothetical protein